MSLPVRVQVAPEVWRLQTLRLLPKEVHWSGELGTEIRSRGIYVIGRHLNWRTLSFDGGSGGGKEETVPLETVS